MSFISAIEIRADCDTLHPGVDIAAYVIDSFLDEVFFSRLIVIDFGRMYLRNRKAYRSDLIYTSIDDCRKLEKEIYKSCTSHGHMSVLLVTSSVAFIQKIKSYFRTWEEHVVVLGSGGNDDPLSSEQISTFIDAFDLNVGPAEYSVVFSHDADYMYIIEPQNEVPN